ncbi:MAG: hypothetical protein ACPLWC_04680, partial [Candidatus Woesearchaeota archaeon]
SGETPANCPKDCIRCENIIILFYYPYCYIDNYSNSWECIQLPYLEHPSCVDSCNSSYSYYSPVCWIFYEATLYYNGYCPDGGVCCYIK